MEGREYWTYIDDSNKHYEISNFGRVRNAKTQRILTLYYDKPHNDYVFNINYKDTPYKKVLVKRAMLVHFGELTRKDNVAIIDANKLPALDNLEIYRGHKMQPKEQRQVQELPNDIILDIYNTISIMVNRQYKKACVSAGIEVQDLIHEATMECVADYNNKGESDMWVFCRPRITKAFNALKAEPHLSTTDYIVGKVFDD